MITLPMGADQELNAERLTQLGAGITLDPITLSSADIREATNAALVSNDVRAAAERLQRENNELPPVSAVLVSILAAFEPAAIAGKDEVSPLGWWTFGETA